MIVPVDMNIDMPVQSNKQSVGLVFKKDLDLLTLGVVIHQHSDRPSYKIHRRLKEFTVDTDGAVKGDFPDELDPKKIV